MVGRKKKNQRERKVSESSDEESLMELFLGKLKKEETDKESDSPNEEGVFEVEEIADKRIIGNENRVGLIVFRFEYWNIQTFCCFRCRLNI